MNVRTCLFLLLSSLCAVAMPASAQDYLYATGSPVFGSSLPIDHGVVDVNNGDIHLEIPIATTPQRGDFALDEKLVYDSRIWKTASTGSTVLWQPTNVPNGLGGWVFSSGLVSGGSVATDSYAGLDPNAPDCGSGSDNYGPQPYTVYGNWRWTDPSGTIHYFPAATTVEYGAPPPQCTYTVPEGNSASGAPASDGSGYYLFVTNYTEAQITGPNGMIYSPVYAGVNSTSGLTISDRNGNTWSADAGGNLVDTRGLTPVKVSSSGSSTYYDVLGVKGVRNRYTVTTETVYFHTAFGQSGVTESSGSFQAIQSIGLPDGSSYTFAYDSGTAAGHYGELTSMTLPTGGVVSYGYANFSDAYKVVNRWASSLVRDGGTTTLTPADLSYCSATSGCQETGKVTTPDANDTLFTFNLDASGQVANASWVQSVKRYQGSVSSGTLLQTATTNYTYQQESGAYSSTYAIPTMLTTVLTLSDVGSYTQTTETLNTGDDADPGEVKVWNFGNAVSNPPDTDTVYQYNNWYFPTSTITKNGAGNQLSSVTYAYDGKGNRTSESDWINTTGTTLNTTMTYDDTGAMITSTSPNGTTTYGHDATDTLVTSTTDPPVPSGVTLEMQTAYDASTGAVTSTTDANGQVTTYSGFDMFNRPTLVSYPDGGSTTIIYRSPNQVGVFREQQPDHGDRDAV
jgi:hypothetical protein